MKRLPITRAKILRTPKGQEHDNTIPEEHTNDEKREDATKVRKERRKKKNTKTNEKAGDRARKEWKGKGPTRRATSGKPRYNQRPRQSLLSLPFLLPLSLSLSLSSSLSVVHHTYRLVSKPFTPKISFISLLCHPQHVPRTFPLPLPFPSPLHHLLPPPLPFPPPPRLVAGLY